MALLTRTPTRTRVTADNFIEVANSPEFADCRIELIDGEIVEMGKSNTDHSWLVGRISVLLGSFALEQDRGEIYVGDAATVIERSDYGRDTVRAPDLVFVSYDTWPRKLPSGLIEVAPDLAIEVLSPGNSGTDRRKKVRQLLGIGCRQVWLVYPDAREVDVHTNEGTLTYRIGDAITCPDILPGFELVLSNIFPD